MALSVAVVGAAATLVLTGCTENKVGAIVNSDPVTRATTTSPASSAPRTTTTTTAPASVPAAAEYQDVCPSNYATVERVAPTKTDLPTLVVPHPSGFEVFEAEDTDVAMRRISNGSDFGAISVTTYDQPDSQPGMTDAQLDLAALNAEVDGMSGLPAWVQTSREDMTVCGAAATRITGTATVTGTPVSVWGIIIAIRPKGNLYTYGFLLQATENAQVGDAEAMLSGVGWG